MKLLLILAAMAGLTAIAFVYRRKSRAPSLPKPKACKANDNDCWCENEVCANNFCLVHCACWCRGKH